MVLLPVVSHLCGLPCVSSLTLMAPSPLSPLLLPANRRCPRISAGLPQWNGCRAPEKKKNTRAGDPPVPSARLLTVDES